MSEKNNAAAKLKETLFMQRKNGIMSIPPDSIIKCDEFCEKYKEFMNTAKTEREVAAYSINALKEAGFVEFQKGMKLSAGDKVYYDNRGKAVIAAIIGTAPITDGVRLCAAHIDSPRLDLKQNPLYEDNEIALFKTHYYGGIKKYQWTTIPLALHGVVIRADGKSIPICIGEDDDDPVFCVSDLLPHLATEQMSKTLAKGITGEQLNIIVGSRPYKFSETSEAVKLAVLEILHDKYG
ncbi:MAG: aminopeptidase, partial [Ruminococcus sp.]|nr:aminopeptidase [Ruminococcus sp.]